jgi:hypothetical protein
MKSLAEGFSARIDSLVDGYKADPRALSVLRILFAVHLLVFPVDYEWVAKVPGAFFQPPPGPFSLVQTAPSAEVLVGLEVLRAALAVVLLVGFRTKSVSVALTVVMVAGAGFTHSFGKVDHFILYELLPVAMAFAGWGSRYSLDARGVPSFRRGAKQGAPTSGLPMFLWALTVGFALLTAAVPKVLTGWLDPSRQATRGYLARDLADPVKIGPLAEAFGGLQVDAFWKFLDYGTIFAESCVLVAAVLAPALLRLSILLILGFHAGVFLVLGIDFAHYLLVYAAFFAFPVRDLFKLQTKALPTRRRRRAEPRRERAH